MRTIRAGNDASLDCKLCFCEFIGDFFFFFLAFSYCPNAVEVMTTICARIPGEGHSVSKTEDGSLLHAAIVFVGWLTCPWRDVFLGGGEVREACFVGSAAMWSQGRDRQDNVLAHGATGQSARAN